MTLGVAFAGCGGDDSSPQQAAAPAVSRRAVAQLQQVAIDETARCMRDKGWSDYRAVHMSEQELNVEEALSNQAYGIDDIQFRRRYGFRAVRLPDGSAGFRKVGGDRDPAHASGDEKLSKADQKRQFEDENGAGPWIEVRTPTSGVIASPSGGCYAAGRKKVFGPDLHRWLAASILVDQFNGMAINEVVRSAPFRAVVRKWSSCMKEQGWTAVRDTERGLYADLSPRKRDAYAVADATCGARFEVQRTGERLEQAARRRLYAKYEGPLLAWNEMIGQAQRRVQGLR